MTNRKYDKLKVQLDKHTGLVNRIVNVVNNQGKALDLIKQDLQQIKHQLSFEALRNSLISESSFRSTHFQLSTEIARIKNALQCAQWRRLSLDFLSSNQLDILYQTMATESQHAETELLVSQPSDLLQLQLSYFYNGEMVTLLLHVPTVPIGSLL
jgi:acetolactate synthase regulatory subunit